MTAAARDAVRWTMLVALLLALVLMPFVLFEDEFDAWSVNLVRAGSSSWRTGAGVAALLASDVFLPIPSSIVSAFAGRWLGFWNGLAAIWLGMTAACLVGYAFGRRASEAAGRFVGPRGMTRAVSLADRHGDYAVVLCRPVPVLAEGSVIVAGIVGRPFGRFVALTGASNLGIAAVYAAVGAFSLQAHSFLVVFLGAVALPGLAMLAGRVWLRERPARRP
jgi:uncharacterized membrane protein YdjX (TVP38/TMEM64 family)